MLMLTTHTMQHLHNTSHQHNELFINKHLTSHFNTAQARSQTLSTLTLLLSPCYLFHYILLKAKTYFYNKISFSYP